VKVFVDKKKGGEREGGSKGELRLMCQRSEGVLIYTLGPVTRTKGTNLDCFSKNVKKMHLSGFFISIGVYSLRLGIQRLRRTGTPLCQLWCVSRLLYTLVVPLIHDHTPSENRCCYYSEQQNIAGRGWLFDDDEVVYGPGLIRDLGSPSDSLQMAGSLLPAVVL
jgi:hypothetical protein